MNNLAEYNDFKDALRPGDVVVFWGDPLDPLTIAIEAFTDGPSHSAIVRTPLTPMSDVVISQSTRPILLRKGVPNGVQHEPLGATITNYGDRAQAAALILSDEMRARLDLGALESFLAATDGKVTYDVADLFEFLLREVPIVGAREWQAENSKALVCSGLVTAALIKSGVLGAGINWSEWSPQNLVEAGIYTTALWLLGSPKLKRFNRLS